MKSDSNENWTIEFSSKAKKQVKALTNEKPDVYSQISSLTKEMKFYGPIRKNWSHFGPLKKQPGIPEDAYHCHIKSGKPTYVACWYVINKKIKILEVFYVGTHEKAPY